MVNGNDEKYAFAGTRSTDDKQYVLYFDSDRKAFVLDKIDSTFNMNLTRTPNNTNPDSLSRLYPQLNADGKPKAEAHTAASSKQTKPKRPAKARAVSPFAKSPRPDIRHKTKTGSALSKSEASQQKPKSKPRKSAAAEDDEEEDDDGGLLVEYPGADTKSKPKDFSPAFTSVRRFDEFMDQKESEADDEDAESDLEIDNDFKLPSPGYDATAQQTSRARESDADDMDVDMEGDDGADNHNAGEAAAADDDFDLEKDLEDAFENIAQDTPADDESEISEED